MIRVKLIATGQTVEIEESAFDAALHERITAPLPEPTPTPTLAPVPTPEGDAGLVAQIGDLVTSRLAEQETRLRASFEAQVAELRTPDRSNVPVLQTVANTVVPYGTGARIAHPQDYLYARLPEEMRPWRSPDADHWSAQWLRGLVFKDSQQFTEATANLERMYPRYQRASTLEGAPDTGGGIGAGTGAELLPHPLSQVVMIARDARAVSRRLMGQFLMTTQTLQVPTAGAVTAAMVAEGSTAAQGEPLFVAELFRANKLQALMKASVEMLADTPFNLISIYTVRAGAAMGALEDVQVATSSGSAPNISEKIAGGNFDEATTTVLIWQDLVGLFFEVTEPYRTTSVWLGNAVTLELVSELVDGNDRPQVLAQGVPPQAVTDVGGVGMLLGRPVIEFPLADGTLLFGDVRQGYGFASRSGIEVAASEHVDFASDLINWKFTERIDGRIVDDIAMKQMADLATVA